MDTIQVTGRLRIHEGRLDDFQSIAQECLRKVQEKDQGTLQYEWFFNDDKTVCNVRETYANSNAVLEHTANLGETWPALLSVVDLELEFYGRPSAELMKVAGDLNVEIFTPFQGINRLTE